MPFAWELNISASVCIPTYKNATYAKAKKATGHNRIQQPRHNSLQQNAKSLPNQLRLITAQ